MNPLVHPLLLFEDNYGYVLTEPDSNRAVIVDPSDGERVWDYLQTKGYELEAILATHHHFDHVAGIEFLTSQKPVTVYSSPQDLDRVPKANRSLEDWEKINIGGLTIQAIHVPGHTLGHVAYRCEDTLFVGDTLFLGGCGRLFEGTAEQLFHSLYEKIIPLPANTRVYPGHEYTVRTRSFCYSIDATNKQLQDELFKAKALREKGLFTVPGSLKVETQTNIFLRCKNPDVIHAVQAQAPVVSSDPRAVFKQLRSMMDVY